jgi:hypothetical protein
MNRGRRWGRGVLIALAALITLIVVIRIVLDPIASHYAHRELDAAESMRGDFERLHISVLPPGYEITRLKIVEHPRDDWKQPLLYVEHMRATASLGELLHGRVSARVRLDEPKIVYTMRGEGGGGPPPDIGAALEKVIPARVERIEVRGGEVLVRDHNAPRHPEIWVHRLELAAENLTTRAHLAGGRPATASASAKLGRSGDLTFFVSANPFARSPDFAGNLAVRGWKVAELYDVVEPATKLQTPEGTLDLFAEFDAHGGEISGGVKPVLKNVKVEATSNDFGNKVKAWIADKGLHLFSDRVPGRNAVVTVVPIKGRLDHPDLQLWPTILGVVRNAFVEGIASGFAHVPPPEAEKKEGPVTQAKHALDKDEGPPKAQPEGKAQPQGAKGGGNKGEKK